MDWIELVGYAGTALTVTAYAMKSSVRLRIAGILSSVAFMAYGFLTHSYPVMLMELILLPLNLLRLLEMLHLVRSVSRAQSHRPGQPDLGWIVPHMTRRSLKPGEILFRRGDAADMLYLVISGAIVLDQGRPIPCGALVGDAAPFTPPRPQQHTARAATGAVVAALPQASLCELYFQNPAFGYRLTQLVISSMRSELDQEQGAQTPSNIIALDPFRLPETAPALR